MALTNTAAKNAKVKEKAYKLYDSEGLFLFVPTSGKKVWRFKYRFNNKEKLLVIGKYPSVSLKEARERRDEYRTLLSEGVDPSQVRQNVKNPEGKTYKEVALEWIAFKSLPNTKRCWKPSHSKAVLRSLDNEVFPVIGNRVITTITPDDIDYIIDPIVKRGALEVAERALSRMNAVFRYGIYKGWTNNNPSLGKNEFLPSRKVRHMAHLTAEQLPIFLTDLEKYQGDFICKKAVQFALLTLIRTDELRFMEWDEIDLEAGLLSIPAERMKMNIAQTIPLSTQAVEILNSVKSITGQDKYVFTSLVGTGKPISENGMLSVIYRMGYKGKTTIHGFRHTYSTIANEVLKFRPDVIEASLAHKVKDPIRGTYNHATYLDERKVNAQVWADFLEEIKCCE
jgi:integrase